MAYLTASRNGLRPQDIRNPTLPRIARAQVCAETVGAAYLETFALGCALAAVAGVLPLVMFLHG